MPDILEHKGSGITHCPHCRIKLVDKHDVDHTATAKVKLSDSGMMTFPRACRNCGRHYKIVRPKPWLVEEPKLPPMTGPLHDRG